MAESSRFARSIATPLLYAGLLVVHSASDVRRYLGGEVQALYVGGVLAVVLLLWFRGRWLARWLDERHALAATVTLIIVLALFFAITYPLANSGLLGPGSDRDEGLQLAVERLLAGGYPYDIRTYLNKPTLLLPGSLLLSVPFVALGNGATQFILWLSLLAIVLRRFLFNPTTTLLAIGTPFLLAPGLLQEIATGSNLWDNGLVVLVAMLLFLGSREGRARTITSLLLGFALATRPNFVLLAPLIASAAAARWGRGTALSATAGALSIAGLLVMGFWVAAPARFTPVGAAGKLAFFDPVLANSTLWITAATALLAVLLALRPIRDDLALLWRSTLVVAFPVLLGVALTFAWGYTSFAYGARYGGLYIFFASVTYWLAWRKKEDAIAPEGDRVG